jgi:LysR family transcriptional regulator for metE and metH
MNVDNSYVDVEIRHLQLVRAVASAGNLTRAGAALHLTQSALSHQLRDIESRLGTSLFLRVGKRMLLTRAGDELLQSAEAVLATIERAESTIRQLADIRGGLLRISTECYTCYHWLPALLKRYRRAHPHVDVQIDATATSAPIGSLVDGRLDVAIVSDPVRDRRVVVQPLFTDELVVIMEPQHRLRSLPFISAGDFAAETLLTYSPKDDSTVYQRLLLPAGVTPRGFQQVQLTEAIVELVKAGLGVAALARWAVEPHLRAGTLCAVPLTRRGYKRTWSAATLKDLARLPHVRQFIDLLAAHPPFAGARRMGPRLAGANPTLSSAEGPPTGRKRSRLPLARKISMR